MRENEMKTTIKVKRKELHIIRALHPELNDYNDHELIAHATAIGLNQLENDPDKKVIGFRTKPNEISEK